MARESKYVKKITGREEKLFTQLSNTGICSLDQAKNFCNIGRDRIIKLQNSKMLIIDKVCPKNGNLIEVVRLGEKGRFYSENILGNEYFYKSSLSQVSHDLKLTENYYKIISEDKGAIWKNETQIKAEFGKLTEQDCIDAMITLSNGEIFALEVVGSKYTKQTIENKQNLGNNLAGKTVLIY